MDFALTEEQLLVKQNAREFAEKEIAPQLEELEREGEFPRQLVKRLGELGYLGMVVPAEYGGSGLDYLTYLLAVEEFSRVDSGAAMSVGLHNSLAAPPLLDFGTEEQKRKYLPGVASGELLAAFALTEPEAGSDAANVQATAVPDGDGWVINGTKNFISNGSVADFVILFVMTDRERGARGITGFVVDTDRPGFRVGTVEKKMGTKLCPAAEIIFEDYRAPKVSQLGELNSGFRVAMQTLDGGRVSVGAQCVGLAEAAFEAALGYARERVQFGKPIAKFQAIQWMLADMRTEIDAARALTWYACWLKDQGKRYSRQAAEAKLFSSEMANRVAHRAMQIHGGYGYMEDYPVEKIFRDARITSIFEGTNEIQRLVIASDLVKRWTP